MKTETSKRSAIKNWLIVGIVLAAGITLGCLLSGDNPLRFLYRLFTMDYIPKLETGATLITVAVFGFLTSFHCIGMCGGVILSQCAGREKGGAAQGLLYNAGRIVSCTLVGFLAGLLGQVFSLNGHLKALVPLVLAAVMLVMGLQMLGLLRWLGGRLGIAEPSFLKKLQGKGAFIVGFATGFMPCGMLQVAQLYALGTGSPLLGALSMLVFAVASSPVLFAFGTLAGSLSVKKRVILMKVAAVIVLLLAFKLLVKGLGLMEVV
jgi:sulfite exporter TauE/SafE